MNRKIINQKEQLKNIQTQFHTLLKQNSIDQSPAIKEFENILFSNNLDLKSLKGQYANLSENEQSIINKIFFEISTGKNISQLTKHYSESTEKTTLNPVKVVVLNLNPSLEIHLSSDDFQLVNTVSNGKGGIIATAFATSGLQPSLLCGFYAGQTGHLAEAILQSIGISNILSIDPENEGETRTGILWQGFDYPSTGLICKSGTVDQNTGSKLLDELDQKIQEEIDSLQTDEYLPIIIAGSLPPGLPQDFMSQLITRLETNSKVRVLLDASRHYLTEGLKGKPYMVKINIDEANALATSNSQEKLDLNQSDEIIKARFKDLFPDIKHVVITQGGQETVYLDLGTDSIHRIQPSNITVVDVDGAGDTMDASLAMDLTHGDNHLAAVQRAVEVGTDSASKEAGVFGNLQIQ